MCFSCFQEWLDFDGFLYFCSFVFSSISKQETNTQKHKHNYKNNRFRPAPETRTNIKNIHTNDRLWPALETRKTKHQQNIILVSQIGHLKTYKKLKKKQVSKNRAVPRQPPPPAATRVRKLKQKAPLLRPWVLGS